MSLPVYALPFVKNSQAHLSRFIKKIEEFLITAPETCITVLPEYCWGNTEEHDILSSIDTIQELLLPKQQMVAGSFVSSHTGILHNSAMYVNGAGLRKFYPKLNVLSEERKRHNIVPGKNPGPIHIDGLSIQTLICADLWNTQYLMDLFSTPIDLLLVPAFTAVPPGFSSYAKIQWYSLAITRSREFLVPLVIADHANNYPDIDVGKVSCIVDPSKKESEMESLTDFVAIGNNEIVTGQLDFQKISAYRDYRLDKGLFHPS